jgi:hypothetical protein
MTHWTGAIILLVAFAFVIFAFRQGEKIKPDKDKNFGGMTAASTNRRPQLRRPYFLGCNVAF